MPIEKINFSYPKGSLQSVFDTEAMTALELAAKTSKKVDECVELVNGVEQSAIEATAVVDEMRIAQEQFMTENNDIRQQLVVDNQEYIDGLNASKATFDANMTTALNNTKNSMDIALADYKTASTNALTDFTADLNETKTTVTNEANAVIANASQQIADNVNDVLVVMSQNGTLAGIINVELLGAINASIAENQVVVSVDAPAVAKTWFDAVGETTIEINGETVILQEI